MTSLAKKSSKKILFVASTFPKDKNDPVQPFVMQEAIWTNKIFPNYSISILAPHNGYSSLKKFTKNTHYEEYRFHYFWPNSYEKLTGRGIMPALKNNKLLYIEIPFFIIFELISLFKLTLKKKPDLLYAHWFMPQAITAAIVSKFTGVPFVFDTQSSDVIVLKKFPFSKKIVNWVCKSANAYTAPSLQTARKLLYFNDSKKGFDIEQKLKIIPLGTSRVIVNKTDLIATLSKYNIHHGKYIYFIGRLVERKGVHILLEAYRILLEEYPDVKLIITGDGIQKNNLLAYVENKNLQDNVIFTGFLAEKERFALLAGCLIGVIPSVNIGDEGEGLPIVFMEGVTMGKPMVITDASGAHEYVKDGVDAFIAKAGSVNSLRNKLQESIKASSPSFSKHIKTFSQQFQWEEIVEKRFSLFLPD